MPWKLDCNDEGCFVVNQQTGRRMNKNRMPEARAKKMLSALYASVPEAHSKEHSGVMVALMLDSPLSDALSILPWINDPHSVGSDSVAKVPAEEMHITLAYLGKIGDMSAEYLQQIKQAIGQFAIEYYDEYEGQPICGEVQGTGRFNHTEDGLSALYYTYSSPTLGCCREALMKTLSDNGIVDASGHGFVPHITYAYVPEEVPTPTVMFPNLPAEFYKISLVAAGERTDYVLASPYDPSSNYSDLPTVEAGPGSQEAVDSHTYQDPHPYDATTAMVNAMDSMAVNKQTQSDNGVPTPYSYLMKAEMGLLSTGNSDDAGQREIVENGPEQSGFSVFKTTDGNYRWVAISSNGYEDRDGQCVSTKALEEDCALADQLASKIGWMAYGPLTFWHMEEPVFVRKGDFNSVVAGPSSWAIGKTDFNMVHDGMLVESGTFFDDSIAEPIAAKAKMLRLSIAFAVPPNSPDEDGVFHKIRRYARTLVPLGHAVPSNRFTSFNVQTTKGRENNAS